MFRLLLVMAVHAGTVAAQAPDRATPRAPITTAIGRLDVLHEPDGIRTAKTVLLVHYRSLDERFADHGQYLEDLQRRFGDDGLGVIVAMPPRAAQQLAAKRPQVLVAERATDADTKRFDGNQFLLCRGTDVEPLARIAHIDCVVDHVRQDLAGKLDAQELQRAAVALISLIGNVADGGEFTPQLRYCLERLPHSGRAHACRVLDAWWSKGDLALADRAIDEAVDQLSHDPPSLVHFLDLVLRGDPGDAKLNQQLLMAATTAAAPIDGNFTQLVYLRALRRSGQQRLAERVASKLEPRLTTAEEHLIFAETLMSGPRSATFRACAERSVQAAEQLGGPPPWLVATRHKIAVQNGDAKAASRALERASATPGLGSSLNNDAWYLMVRPDTMGRFDTLALAFCEAMVRIEGRSLDGNSKDTVAQAMYLNGRLDDAIRLQQEVVRDGGGLGTYAARLRRYKEARARRD